jgi:hypothetical protein
MCKVVVFVFLFFGGGMATWRGLGGMAEMMRKKAGCTETINEGAGELNDRGICTGDRWDML